MRFIIKIFLNNFLMTFDTRTSRASLLGWEVTWSTIYMYFFVPIFSSLYQWFWDFPKFILFLNCTDAIPQWTVITTTLQLSITNTAYLILYAKITRTYGGDTQIRIIIFTRPPLLPQQKSIHRVHVSTNWTQLDEARILRIALHWPES